jgi:hypothetical protein
MDQRSVEGEYAFDLFQQQLTVAMMNGQTGNGIDQREKSEQWP